MDLYLANLVVLQAATADMQELDYFMMHMEYVQNALPFQIRMELILEQAVDVMLATLGLLKYILINAIAVQRQVVIKALHALFAQLCHQQELLQV